MFPCISYVIRSAVKTYWFSLILVSRNVGMSHIYRKFPRPCCIVQSPVLIMLNWSFECYESVLNCPAFVMYFRLISVSKAFELSYCPCAICKLLFGEISYACNCISLCAISRFYSCPKTSLMKRIVYRELEHRLSFYIIALICVAI